MPQDEREVYLREISLQDEVLGEELSQMLSVSEQAGSFFDADILPKNMQFMHQITQIFGSNFLGIKAPEIPDSIGRFEITSLLGYGGMGVVYLAIETGDDFTRECALKVLNQDCKEKYGERLKLERKALALMNHDHIARFIEFNETEDGDQYIAMEYVDGDSITTFCDEVRAGLRERLRLFIQVCRGVQHAHERGVIHGDLKPANVLVTKGDIANAKIVDFGISRGEPLEGPQKDGEEQAFGSPPYMSPESANLDLVTSTKSDIYSLGALLFELLSGTMVWRQSDFVGKTQTEVLEMVRFEDRPTLTQRIQRLGEASEDIAACRQLNVKSLARAVHGDLDAIVASALAIEPENRYETVAALAQDVQCYLDSEPVSAVSPTKPYVLGKWVGRNKLVAGLGCGGLLAFIIVVLVSWISLYLTNRAKENAEKALADLSRTHEFYKKMLVTPHPNRLGYQISFIEVLQTWETSIDAYTQGDVWLEAQVRQNLGEIWMAQNQNMSARKQLERVQDLYADHETIPEEDRLRLASRYAMSLRKTGDIDEAERLFQQTLQRQAELQGAHDPNFLRTLAALALLQLEKQDRDAALASSEQAYQGLLIALGEDHHWVHESGQILANVFLARNQWEQAEALLREILASQNRVFGPRSATSWVTLQNIAATAFRLGRYDEAEAFYRELLDLFEGILAPDHAHVLTAKHGLAYALRETGCFEEADQLLKSVLEKQMKKLGIDHGSTLWTMFTRARIYAAMNDLNTAINELSTVLQIYEESDREMEWLAHRSRNNMGEYLRRAGALSEAQAVLEETLFLKRAIFAEDEFTVLATRVTLGQVFWGQGRQRDALSLVQAAITDGDRNPSLAAKIAEFRIILGGYLIERERFDEAETELKRAEADLPEAEGKEKVRHILEDLNRIRESSQQ